MYNQLLDLSLTSANHWGLFSLSMASFSPRTFHWNLPRLSPKGSLIFSPSLKSQFYACGLSAPRLRLENLCMCSLHISSKWLIKLGIVSVAGKKKGEQPSRGQRSRFSEKTRMRKCVGNSEHSLYLRPQHVTSRAG